MVAGRRVHAFLAAGAISAATTLAGCNLYRPGFFEPRTIQQQRYSAVMHDPFADPDAGPEMVGVRPRDFQVPHAEPVRTRWLQDSWWAQ